MDEKLDMLNYLAEKRNSLLKEKHKCLRNEVAQLKDLFMAMKNDGELASTSESVGTVERNLLEAQNRIGRNVPDKKAASVDLLEESDLVVSHMRNSQSNSEHGQEYIKYLEEKVCMLTKRLNEYYSQLENKELVDARTRAFEELQWVKENMSKIEDSLTAFQQAHDQIAKEKELLMEELEGAKALLARTARVAEGTGHAEALERVSETVATLRSAKKALEEDIKEMEAKHLTAEAQLLDAIAMVNELKDALQQVGPLKQMLEAANEQLQKSSAKIDRLNHTIYDLRHEQDKSCASEVRLKDAMETISRLTNENDVLKLDLKATTVKYLAAEKQLLESFDCIRDLKERVSELANRLPGHGGTGADSLDTISELRRRVTELEEESCIGAVYAALQDAMSTIAQLKASKSSLEQALKEAEPMKKMLAASNEQLRQANNTITILASQISEPQSDLTLERDKLKDTMANIERVNLRLQDLQKTKNDTQARSESSTNDIMSMITLLNSRLCALEQNLNEQVQKRAECPKPKLKQFARPSNENQLKIEKNQNHYQKLEGALAQAHEEYRLLSSEITEMQSKKEIATATLKSLDESISEKRKVLEHSELSMEKALSGVEKNATKAPVLSRVNPQDSKKLESKPIENKGIGSKPVERKLLIGESSGTKTNTCKVNEAVQTEQELTLQNIEKERYLSGHGVLWEFDQNRRRFSPSRKRLEPERVKRSVPLREVSVSFGPCKEMCAVLY